MRTGHFALAILLAFGVGAITARAQDNSAATPQSGASAGSQVAQPDPLAAAARRAREQQKTAPKAAKVYTNDNLPTNATISFVGAPASSASGTNGADSQAGSAPSAPAAQAAAPESGEKKAQDEAALVSAKAQLESEKKDLDIDQRKYALDDQMWLSSPNHDGNSDGATNLQNEQDAISAKQDEVTAAQKVVDDLESRLNASPSAASAANNSAGGNSTSGTSDSGSSDTGSSSSAGDAGASSSSPSTAAGGVSLSSN